MSILTAVTDVLQLLADGEREVGMATLVQRLGWPKSTASRVLAQMAEHGLLERDPQDRQYRLGMLVMKLGQAHQLRCGARVESQAVRDRYPSFNHYGSGLGFCLRRQQIARQQATLT